LNALPSRIMESPKFSTWPLNSQLATNITRKRGLEIAQFYRYEVTRYTRFIKIISKEI